MRARLICNETKYCDITPLLVDLHWLPVKLEFKILLIVFKIFSGLAPSQLSFLIISKPVSKNNLRSSNDSTLISYPNTKPKATLGERAFVFAAPKSMEYSVETYQGIHFSWLLTQSWRLTFLKTLVTFSLDHFLILASYYYYYWDGAFEYIYIDIYAL